MARIPTAPKAEILPTEPTGQWIFMNHRYFIIINLNKHIEIKKRINLKKQYVTCNH